MDMNQEHTRKLRALLLASIAVVAVVAGSVGFVGSTVADEHHQLNASDGAGGNASFVFANASGQLPTGVQSEDDTLQVEAEGDSFDDVFWGELHLDGQDVQFDTSQTSDDIELVVYGDSGTVDSENTEIHSIESDVIGFQVGFEGEEPLLGANEEPIGVRMSNVTFDAGAAEDATLRWNVPEGTTDEAEYTLEVREFEPGVTAVDDDGGKGAQLTDGAAAQQMTAVQGGRNLVLEGDELEFPSEFEATLTLDEDGITFTEGTADQIGVSTSSGNASIEAVTSTELTVAVSDFDGTGSDEAIVELDGVRFDVEPGSESEVVTWSVGNSTAHYLLTPVQLEGDIQTDHEFTRGLDQQPPNGVTVELSADWHQDGTPDAAFHAGGERMTVIAHHPGLVFDQSQTPEGEVEGGLLADDLEDVRFENESAFSFVVPTDVDHDDTIVVRNVRFNTTAVDESDPADDRGPASFTTGLDVVYSPENKVGDVRIGSDDALHAKAPNVTVDGAPTTLPLHESSTAGDEPVSVTITDTSGNQMAAGSAIVVGLEGSGISLDPDQDLSLNGSFANAVRIESVTSDEIVLRVSRFASSDEGDTIVVEGLDGEGISFDTTEAAHGESTAFTVKTNASDAPVTQVTESVATTEATDVVLSTETEALTVDIEDQPVAVSVLDDDGNPIDGLEVVASGDPIGSQTKVSQDGEVTFELSPAATGEIKIDTENETLAEPIFVQAERASLTVEPPSVAAGDRTDIEVDIVGADGELLTGHELTVTATSDRIEDRDEPTTTGTVLFEDVTVSEEGDDVTIDVPQLEGVDATVEVHDAELDASPTEITPGESATVVANLTDAQTGAGIENASVVASGSPLADEVEANELGDGEYELELTADEPGDITISAIEENGNFTVHTTIAANASITLDPDELQAGETTDVTVETTGAFGEPVDVDVVAFGDPLEDNVTGTTTDGEIVLELDPSQAGEIGVEAASLGITEPLQVTAAEDDTSSPGGGDDDGSTGSDSGSGTSGGSGTGGGAVGGGGGGSGGYAPPASASFEITSTDLDQTVVDVGDAVSVTVTVENTGNGDGTYDAALTADGETVAEGSVEVAEGETEELTLVHTFEAEGVFDLAVDGVEVGTVHVGVDPAEVVASDTVEISDEAPGEPGLRTVFGDVPVRAITFSNASATGEVTVEELSKVPPGIAAPEGVVVRVVEISVPEAEADNPATVEIVVDADAIDAAGAMTDDLSVVRYDESAGAWESLEFEVLSEGDEVLLSAETPGFSTFAVTAQENDHATPTPTPEPDDGDEATPTLEPDDDGLFSTWGLFALGMIGLIVLMLAFAGARVYEQGEVE